MSTATWLAVAAIGLSVVLGIALVRIRHRLSRLEASTRRLHARLEAEIEPAVAAARADARRASAAARDAAIAAGVTEAPPRLPFEPVTGRVVRAVAFGAGARRAFSRVTAPRWRSRATSARTRGRA